MTRHTNIVTYVDPYDVNRLRDIAEPHIQHVPRDDAIEWLSYLQKNPGIVLVAIDGDHAIRAFQSDTHLWHGRIADTSDDGVLFATLEPWGRRMETDYNVIRHFKNEWVPKSQIEFAVAVSR